MQFSPFNNIILDLAYEDKSTALWGMTKGHIDKNISKKIQIYNTHNNKVNYVSFNPIVDYILFSESLDKIIHIWNFEKGDNNIKFKSEQNLSMILLNPKW